MQVQTLKIDTDESNLLAFKKVVGSVSLLYAMPVRTPPDILVDHSANQSVALIRFGQPKSD